MSKTAEMVRFGAFQLDLRTSELTKNGVKIRIPDQSLKILAMLLEHPGELIAREEIQRRLWPDDTTVDFEFGINSAVTRLRAALSDSARAPRYIETLARRGYRFIATMDERTTPVALPCNGNAFLPPEQVVPLPAIVRTPGRVASARTRILIAAAIIVMAAAAPWIAYRRAHPIPLKSIVRLAVDLGQDVSVGSPYGPDVLLSPDGARLVYVTHNELVTRKLDDSKATKLAFSSGAQAPFISPDGRWVAFFASGKLKTLPIEGVGQPANLCDAPNGAGGSWGADGAIVAALSSTGPLSRIPAGGGAPVPVTRLQPGELTHRWPQVLPGNEAVLFTANGSLTDFGAAAIVAVRLADGKRKTLVRDGTFGRYLAERGETGFLTYIQNGVLFAIRFDPNSLETSGKPVPVLDQVGYNWQTGSAQLDFSESGTLVYRSGVAETTGLVTVQWMDRDGATQPLLARPGRYFYPHLSPNNERLAIEIAEGAGRDIWIYDLRRDVMTRLTFGVAGSANMNPVWTPDGRYIVFAGKGGIYSIPSNGTGKPRLLFESRSLQLPYSIARNGRRLALMQQALGGGVSVSTIPLEMSDAGPACVRREDAVEMSSAARYPVFSPDGRWMAYSSDVSGTYEVYVRTFPDQGGNWQVSSGGGAYPVWSSNGHDLLFRSLDSRFMVVSYQRKGDAFVAEKPRPWSQKRLLEYVIGQGAFDLSSDGERIVMLAPFEADGRTPHNEAIFLENFLDDVQRRLGSNGR